MTRIWLLGLALAASLGIAGCSESTSGASPGGSARIVASDDGTVEVIVGGKTLFALAPAGPVARTFDDVWGNIGAKTITRFNEATDPMAVQSVENTDNGAMVEYANADGSRTARLEALVVDDEVSEFKLEVAGTPADSLAVGIRCDEGGTFHGFGLQYNATNQRGEKFQLFVNDQGAGRDGGPGLNRGNAHTTYFPMPYYVDARGFGALFITDARANVDLCATDADIAWVEVITGGAVQWRVFHGPTALDVIRQLGDLTGRPKLPPAWAYGLWLASQGGRDDVLADVDALEAAGIPASALWVQDWTGIRPNPEGGFGVQYLWDAKQQCSSPDDVCYPNLAEMIDGLHDNGYKFLAYSNPFIVNPDSVEPEELDDRFAARFDPMESMGLLVNDEEGETYIDPEVPNFPQLDAHPDFSRTETADFIRSALVSIVETYGIDGWMADFGEYIPPDSFHADGSNAEERRNTFPVDWARANSEALAQARPDGEWAMLSRSGFTNVQGHAQIHWVGDQQTDWGENDGIPTVTPALLNLGLAGQPFVSLDIGGFSSVGTETRTEELFMRWTELGAFAPVMRTHEGAEKDLNVQWNNNETIDHFRKFTYVHCALKDDFMALATEAAESGAPILRHLMLVFPDDRETWDISDQFMIGDSLLVAPVTEQGASSRSVYFPAGTWFNVWEPGETVTGGQRATVDAPIGEPPVYSRDRDRDDIRNWNTLSFDDCR